MRTYRDKIQLIARLKQAEKGAHIHKRAHMHFGTVNAGGGDEVETYVAPEEGMIA